MIRTKKEANNLTIVAALLAITSFVDVALAAASPGWIAGAGLLLGSVPVDGNGVSD